MYDWIHSVWLDYFWVGFGEGGDRYHCIGLGSSAVSPLGVLCAFVFCCLYGALGQMSTRRPGPYSPVRGVVTAKLLRKSVARRASAIARHSPCDFFAFLPCQMKYASEQK